LKTYTEKRVARILPQITKLETKQESLKGKDTKSSDQKQVGVSEHSVVSNDSAKTAAERGTELRNG